MSLIRNVNEKRNPQSAQNREGVDIPRIRAPLPEPEAATPQQPLPTDGGLTAQQEGARELEQGMDIQDVSPQLMAPSGHDTMMANSAHQMRQEFDWRRNQLLDMPTAPLVDSTVLGPHRIGPSRGAQGSGIGNLNVLQDDVMAAMLSTVTGIDPVQTSQRNALGGMNLFNRNREEGFIEDRVGDVMMAIGFENDNPLTRGLTNLAGLGGTAIGLAESAADWATDHTVGPLWDQTIGRVLWGSPEASREATQRGRENLRSDDVFAPSRQVAAALLEPNNDSLFGVYGSGLPGAAMTAMAYAPDVIVGSGLSAWRAGRTIEHALRGEEYDYSALDTLGEAWNPFNNRETFSFLDDPEYSPVSIQGYVRPLDEAQGPLDFAGRALTNTLVVSTGFLLDSAVPDFGDIPGLSAGARRSVARRLGRTAGDVAADSAAAPNLLRQVDEGNNFQNLLPGNAPDQPRLPGSSGVEFRPDDFIAEGEALRIPPRPGSGGAGAVAELDYSTLYTSPDGITLDVPAQRVPDIQEFIESAPPTVPEALDFEIQEQQLGDFSDPNDNVFRRALDEPEPETLDDALDAADDAVSETVDDAVESSDPTIADETSPVTPADEIDSTQVDPEVGRPSASSGDVPEPQRVPDSAPDSPTIRDVERTAPVRTPGTAEALVRRSVDAGDVEVTPKGFVRSTDAQQAAQKAIIANRLEAEAIQRVPENLRRPAEVNRLKALDAEFSDLRPKANMSGRRPAMQGRPVIDDALPVVPQSTLKPPANPAKLYQWSRNLPEGQRIYLDDVDFETRSARDLTELAKFMGHADVGRTRVLSGEQITQLRQTYGSMYSTTGPAIDHAALKRLNDEGVGRVEVTPADLVNNQPQVSRIYENPVTRTFDRASRNADEFTGRRSFTATEMSEMTTEAIDELLANDFSNRAVYRSGTRDSQIARVRAELLDEKRFREADPDAGFPEADLDEIEEYLDDIGNPDFDTDVLDDAQFDELAERAAISAERKARVPVEEVKRTLPDNMRPDSPQGDAAVRELIAAEQELSDMMAPVRELAENIEALERQMAIDGRRLNGQQLPQDLNTGTYGAAGRWHTRQMEVDKLADRTAKELERLRPSSATRTDASVGPVPVAGRVTGMGEVPLAGKPVRTLDGSEGVLTGSQVMDGAEVSWEVRLPDGSTTEVPRAQVFEPEADVTRRPPEATQRWYLGTRADVELANYSPIHDSATHSPLGPGAYVMSRSENAQDAAVAYVRESNVANHPIGQGRVHTVMADVDNVMDGSTILGKSDVWEGFHGLIKEFFTDPKDVRNITSAARRKSLPDFYDYLTRKLKDDVRVFDFKSRATVYLHAQGIDAIRQGDVMNVIKPRALVGADTVPVGSNRAMQQFAAEYNHENFLANTFGTQSLRTLADHTHFRMGMQIRDHMIGLLQEASDRVNKALERLNRADIRLEEITEADRAAKEKAEQLAERRQLDEFVENNSRPRDCM